MRKRLALLGACLWSSAVWAQSPIPQPFPTPPSVDVTPEMFPGVTPMPPKAPATTPSPIPSSSAIPSSMPTPQMTSSPRPTALPTGQGTLKYQIPSLKEGQKSTFLLEFEGSATYPLKGTIQFEDGGYDLSSPQVRSIPFELKGPGAYEVPVVFRTPGRKKIKIAVAATGIATRHILAQVSPLMATIFPRPIQESLSRDPKRWQVFVNLHYANSAKGNQRQYYLVTHDGVVIQKLLTSSATPDKITPLGSFRLGPKAERPKSTLYDSEMPFWTTILIPGYSYEYGNHGLVGEAYLYSLGAPASHGCLRLSDKTIKQGGQWVNIGAAKWVYSHVPVGTSIRIFKRPAEAFAYENYRAWLSQR